MYKEGHHGRRNKNLPYGGVKDFAEIVVKNPDAFGDAAVANVTKGRTFTSAAGLKLTGTHTCPTLASMTSSATATAADIVSGKTAYVNGTKITGTASLAKTSATVAISSNRSSISGAAVASFNGTSMVILLASGGDSRAAVLTITLS